MNQVELPSYGELLWDEFRHLALHGGRGAGKSRTVATALVIQATQRHERVLCGREIQKSIKDSVKRLLDDEIDRLGLRPIFTSTETEIRGPNDSLFLFSGIKGNASGIKSIEGITTYWGEEAHTTSQASLDTVIPTIRAPGSRLIWTWNPDLPTDPIDAMFRGVHGAPPNSIIREVNYDENPWFPEVLRVAMEHDQTRDIDKYNHIWRGQYRRNSEARVFKNWRVEAFETPPGMDFRLGADFGFSIDPSCALRCYISGREIFIDHEAWGLGVEIDRLSHLFMGIPDAERWPMVADSSRPETISFLRRNGFPLIIPAIKGARSVEEGVEFLKSYDLVIHPRCQHLIDELTLYSWKVDSLTGLVLPQLEDKDNHCIAEGQRVQTKRGFIPIEQVTTADDVMTRAGFKRVAFAGVTDVNRKVLKIETTTGSLICTPDHRIFANNSFVRADALRYGDEVIGDAAWSIHSSSTGRSTGAIRRASAAPIGFIISALRQAGQSACTALFGNITTGRSRKAGMSTTRTAIQTTTTLPILRVCHCASMWRSILTMPNDWKPSGCISTISAILRASGTPARKEGQSIAKSAAWPMLGSSRSQSNASNAPKHSCRVRLATWIGSVATSAKLRIGAHLGLIMNSGLVRSVMGSLKPTDILKHKPVRGRVLTVTEIGVAARVYDLTVEGQHEFFCEGVLVHNCIDALRYAVEGARRARKPTTFSAPIPTMARWN